MHISICNAILVPRRNYTINIKLFLPSPPLLPSETMTYVTSVSCHYFIFSVHSHFLCLYLYLSLFATYLLVALTLGQQWLCFFTYHVIYVVQSLSVLFAHDFVPLCVCSQVLQWIGVYCEIIREPSFFNYSEQRH